MAHFITACVFQKGIKTVKIDKAAMDYYMHLTSFYSQFRAVGVSYNKVVKMLYGNFSEKKAAAYPYKLETKDDLRQFGMLVINQMRAVMSANSVSEKRGEAEWIKTMGFIEYVPSYHPNNKSIVKLLY